MNASSWPSCIRNDSRLDLGECDQRTNDQEHTVTVCIAAKSKEGMIFGISDRMVTAGDIQFEPPAKKIFQLTTSIVAMTSDNDAAVHHEILQDLTLEVLTRVTIAPNDWLNVRDVAELYLKFRNDAKRRRAERDVLMPFGLTSQSYLDQSATLSNHLIDQLNAEVLNYRMPAMSVIFCGVDRTGSHIYVTHNGDIGCYDAIGFACIGSGARHASSQFMFQGHTPDSPGAETLLLAYMAKKRAEVAPGVGDKEDIFIIGPGLGSYQPGLRDELHKKLEVEYGKIVKKESAELIRARSEMNVYVERLGREDAAPQQPSTAGTAPTPIGPTEIAAG